MRALPAEISAAMGPWVPVANICQERPAPGTYQPFDQQQRIPICNRSRGCRSEGRGGPLGWKRSGTGQSTAGLRLRRIKSPGCGGRNLMVGRGRFRPLG